MHKFCFLMTVIFTGTIISCVRVTTYYVDPVQGNDESSGSSPGTAWKSIERVNRQKLNPGDSVLFSGGESFDGTLLFDSLDSGTKDAPVAVSSYGNGRAVVNGGKADACIATHCSYLCIQQIDFKGDGRKNGNTGSGLVIDGGAHVLIDSIDVSGFRENGIAVLDASDVRITHVHAHENGMAGIQSGRVHQSPRKLLTKNLYIGDCITDNNPGNPVVLDNHSGSGIIISGADSALVEYCLSKNNGWDMPWKGNGPVGIWVYHSNNVTIQRCISHDNKSNPEGWDGGGFDLDGGVTNSVLQYNLSYHNAGPGYGLFQYLEADSWSDNMARYNISYNDGLENDSSGIHLWSGQQSFKNMRNAQVYNNLIVNETGRAVSYKHGDFPGLVFQNNIFISYREPVYGVHNQSVFNHNLFYRTGNQPVADKKEGNIYADPGVLSFLSCIPGTENPRSLDTLMLYPALPGAPWLGTGKFIRNNGGTDFNGRHLPPDSIQATDIGIYQYDYKTQNLQVFKKP